MAIKYSPFCPNTYFQYCKKKKPRKTEHNKFTSASFMFVLRFYGPVNPMGVMSSVVSLSHVYWESLVL